MLRRTPAVGLTGGFWNPAAPFPRAEYVSLSGRSSGSGGVISTDILESCGRVLVIQAAHGGSSRRLKEWARRKNVRSAALLVVVFTIIVGKWASFHPKAGRRLDGSKVKGVAELLGRPCGRGMVGDGDVADPSLVVREDDEHEQQPVGDRWHDEEIGSHDLADVVGQERSPPL
jgi:hypothetical protein